MYPLAVESEWSIRDQVFEELQPGESCEALLVSAPEVSDRLSPEMIWRIRLRTGIDQTETLGVRFRKDESSPVTVDLRVRRPAVSLACQSRGSWDCLRSPPQ